VVTQIRQNFDKIQGLSAEKLSLARKVYAYVEANVVKIGAKMRQIEEQEQGITGAAVKATGKKEENAARNSSVREGTSTTRKHSNSSAF
jgi:hypothetical protein